MTSKAETVAPCPKREGQRPPHPTAQIIVSLLLAYGEACDFPAAGRLIGLKKVIYG